MGTIKGVRDKYKEALSEVIPTVQKVVNDNQDVLLSLNTDQMLLGRDAKGDVFTPGYTDDPYFKTPEKAKGYKKMKEGLESSHKSRMSNVQLYPDKDSNTPNLIVSGPFQDAMFINISSNEYKIGSTYVDASDINAKYNKAVFGLAPRSKAYFYNNWVHPAIMRMIKEKLKKG